MPRAERQMVRAAFVCLALASMLAGGGMVAMKYALLSFAPAHLACARVAVSGMFWLCLWRSWRLPALRGDVGPLCLILLLDPVCFVFLQALAMQYTTASQGAVMGVAYPIVAALFARIFLGERLTRQMGLALVLAVCGMTAVTLCGGGEAAAPAPNPLLGNALVVAAMAASAGYVVCARHLSGRWSAQALSAMQALGATAVFLPLALATDVPRPVRPEAVAGLAWLGVFSGLTLYLAQNFAVRWIQAGTVALFANLIPVSTLLLAWLLLDETLSAGQVAAMLVVFAALGLAVAGTLRQRHRRN